MSECVCVCVCVRACVRACVCVWGRGASHTSVYTSLLCALDISYFAYCEMYVPRAHVAPAM